MPASLGQTPSSYDFCYVFQVYNGTDLPRVLKDIKVTFYENDSEIFTTSVEDEHKATFAEVININPKQIEVFYYLGSITQEDVSIVIPANKIEMVYYDEKDKKHSMLLTGEPIKNTGFYHR